MNQIIYSELLTFSKYLLSKDSNCRFDSQDIVHECWDFETEDIVPVKREMSKFFWKNLRQPTIPFSSFKNIASGEIVPIEVILKNGNKKYVHNRQCIQCGGTKLGIDKRNGYVKKLCNKCIYKRRKEQGKVNNGKYNPETNKRYYQKHREEIIEKAKAYQKRAKELRKLNYLKHRARHLKANRLRGLLYYERNKEKICTKRKEMRKLGILKECPIKARERYLRYKNKHKILTQN